MLAVFITIVAFESGVHAVHHLGDPDGGARCAVASVTSHLNGTADPLPVQQPALAAPTGHLGAFEPLPLGTRPLSPHRGRAPPPIAS
jgi:hypothetical protein